jgi:predicted CoA-substrate-specific enzyme activase
MWCVGVDAGSRTIKAVVWDRSKHEVAARGLVNQGIRQAELAAELVQRLLRELGAGPGDVVRTVATGYGRTHVVHADQAVTEISCHARGVRHLHPDARMVIDIGGQDSKVIWLDPGGHVHDFVMNDRCAAGTGRFLEVVAARLETDLAGLGEQAARSTHPVAISSTCVVFAETEIIGLLSARTPPADLAAGIQRAVAARIGAMVGRRAVPPILFTGGVALVSGMAEILALTIGHVVELARDPQYTGALGAALIAADQAEDARARAGSRPRTDVSGGA